MKMEVNLKDMGLDSLGSRIARHAQEVCDVGAEATVAAGREAVSETHGAGVKYSSLPNQSSAPGQAPQGQFGDLAETFRTSREEVSGIGTDALAGDGSGKATALEAGTSRIAPRPFWEPASHVGIEAAQAKLVEVAADLRKEQS